MDDICTATVSTSSSRALVHVASASRHATASMSAQPTFAGFPVIEATKPATKRNGYEPTRNWYPARRPPGST